MGSIYRLYPRNQPEFYYIGLATQTLEQRLKQHKSCYKCYCNGTVKWKSAFKIFEKDPEPLTHKSRDELHRVELWYQSY